MTSRTPISLCSLCCVALLAVACSSGNNRNQVGQDDHHQMVTDGADPINFLRYDDNFASAGMPEAKHITRFAAQGVVLIVNTAPPTSDGSLANEGKLVEQAGMRYINIPVDWKAPTQNDVDLVLKSMRSAKGQSVVLHCQMNMRATAFAFLYRVIDQRVAPEQALADMNTIWTPNPTWTALINEALARHQIDFKLDTPTEE